MSDRIVGIAVLDKTEWPETLHVLCEKSDGHRMPTSIPVYEKGTDKTLENQWQYVTKGDTLEVTPSVNWIGVFHNDSKWEIPFVLKGDEYPHAGDQFRAVNGLQL